MRLNEIYNTLLKNYNYQGWWPIVGYKSSKSAKAGYHPEDYTFPRNSSERFEIIIGAVLTQNTSWFQVEKSLINLKKLVDLTPENILDLNEKEFKLAIKPSGYFNQKYNLVFL